MTDLDDLFEPAFAKPLYGVANGRYQFPPPPGQPENPRGWMRMTNLASAFSDQKALHDWLDRKLLEGMRVGEGLLVDEWLSTAYETLEESDQKAIAKEWAERFRVAAKSDAGARRGTARHAMMENWYRHNVRTGTRPMLAQLDSALEALDAHDLEILDIEFYVWHPLAGGAMGKSDARVMCRKTGQMGILDWKTQASFWSWQEVAGQLYGYHSAPWRWEGPPDDRGQWAPASPLSLVGRPGTEFAGKPIALVAHMPQHPGPGQLPVTIKEVDLAYGRQVLECAARNVELRSIGRSVAEGRRAGATRELR